MSMQPVYRTYSSDSVGSDRVFTDGYYYQGMLKATDGRKGRIIMVSNSFD
jgi:hypothetical protein